MLGVVLHERHAQSGEDSRSAGGRAALLGWNIWYQPLACLIFYISSLAESNRLPFDLSECEQELVGGYHTEYGGLRMVLFFVGEYTHLVTISFLTCHSCFLAAGIFRGSRRRKATTSALGS